MSIDIILASSSPYRRAMLSNLGLKVRCESPAVDETAYAQESPQSLVERLALEKCHAIDADDSYVIACDQVCVHAGIIYGKPHTMSSAYQQLASFSGQAVTFYTGLALLYRQQTQVIVEPFTVHFRHLHHKTIEHYLRVERPLDCAGSFKAEGLGILLFKALQGRDPNALIGLPMIALNELFELYGVNLLTCAQPLA